MTLLQHRTLLASWLQDTANVQWSAAKLREIINLACREVEKHILAHDPEAFKCTYLANTVIPSAGKDNLYSFPAGTFAVHEIALSSDGIYFIPLPRRGLGTVRTYAQAGGSERCFVPYDANHFMLYPAASTVVTSGLRIIVAPTLGLEDDTDESPLPLPFETLHILEAKKFALLDVGEPTDGVQGEIDKIKAETPRFFLTNTQPMFFEPTIVRY
jgi:hypothetical protein